ncbi:MAG: hypothetical protein NT029_01795 [Armatimonadetes bacterium]|nr:hypothetical protein [Armatimonadota bacterium]
MASAEPEGPWVQVLLQGRYVGDPSTTIGILEDEDPAFVYLRLSDGETMVLPKQAIARIVPLPPRDDRPVDRLVRPAEAPDDTDRLVRPVGFAPDEDAHLARPAHAPEEKRR